jgi:large subunit ribosomal protein L9
MKILLTQDVEKLGRAGELKEVAGGFGRNYLIPKGYAVLATRGQIRQAEERMRAQSRRAAVARQENEALAERINGTTVRFEVRAGELDRLYGSVTSADIAEKLSAQLGFAVDRRKIDLDEPIKRIGIYPIKLRVASGLEPLVNVVVEGEGGAGAGTSAAEAESTAME